MPYETTGRGRRNSTEMRILAIIGLSALLFAGPAYTGWNSGAGIVYKLQATQDVWLEGTFNKNSYDFLIVAQHPQFPNKRSLLQFESLPSECTHIKWAKMYLFFWYAHKASGQSVQYVPYISRTLQVYQVKQEWNETQATSVNRLYNTSWNTRYLALDGSDAGPHAIGSTTIFTARPVRSFVEIDITEAMRNWQYGDPNHGMLLMASNEDALGRDFRFAGKTSDLSRRPFVHVLCD